MKFGINRVKIRILSGGKEHSTLESLRESFSLEDVLPSYIDGRLATWLRQRDENDLADRLEKIQADGIKSPKLELKLINEFFGTEYKSVLEYAKYCENANNSDLAYDYVTSLKNEDDLIELARLGKLSPEKAKAKGVCGKTMYIICRTLLKDAGNDNTKKEKAYQWKYLADKLDDEETKDFRGTDNYKEICHILPKEETIKINTFTVDGSEAVDFGLSVYWEKRTNQEYIDSYDKGGLFIIKMWSNWRLPNEEEALEIEKIISGKEVAIEKKEDGIVIGNDNNSTFLKFFQNNDYGRIWLSHNKMLSYNKDLKFDIITPFNKAMTAFVLQVHNKERKSDNSHKASKNNSEKVVDGHKAIDIGLSVLWSENMYRKDLVINPQEITWKGGWRYPNGREIFELMSADFTVTKQNGNLGILIGNRNQKLFLPFFKGKREGYIWYGEHNDPNRGQIHYTNRTTKNTIEFAYNDKGAYIFPVLPK